MSAHTHTGQTLWGMHGLLHEHTDIRTLELKATAVTDVHKYMHMCDDIQVYMVGTTGALLCCEDKLGCGHNICRCTETGIDGYHWLGPGSLYRSGWRHVGLAGLGMQ